MLSLMLCCPARALGYKVQMDGRSSQVARLTLGSLANARFAARGAASQSIDGLSRRSLVGMDRLLDRVTTGLTATDVPSL